MRRFVLSSVVVLGAMLTGSGVTRVDACPMCKYANENAQSEAERARPRAYMYSILFMLSMPATLVAGYSLAFYRMWKKQQELQRVSLDDAGDLQELL